MNLGTGMLHGKGWQGWYMYQSRLKGLHTTRRDVGEEEAKVDGEEYA